MSNVSVIIPVGVAIQDDRIETDKCSTIDKPHNGKPVTKIEVSPNDKYLITYSEEDHSIVGWNVETTNSWMNGTDIEEGRLTPDTTVKINDKYKNLYQICVSDDKKLVCIYIHGDRNYLKIIDMNNIDNPKVELYFNRGLYSYYCTFNLKKEFILCGNIYDKDAIKKDIYDDKKIDRYVWIYSTQTEHNKWMCKGIYKIPKDFELISISKHDKLYLLSNHFVYEWNIRTEKAIRSIFVNKAEADDIKITSNEKFICLKINDEITIYSAGLEIPIASLDINNDTQLYNFMKNSCLLPLLPSLSSLFNYTTSGTWNSMMKNCWEKCLDRLTKNDQIPMKYQTESLPILSQTTSKYVYGILDGYVWKVKFEEKIKFSDSDDSDDDPKEINEEEYKYLNIHLFTDIDTSLHQDLIDFINDTMTKEDDKHDDELEQDLIKIKFINNDKKKEFELQVFKKINDWEWELICERIEKCNFHEYKVSLLGIKLFNTNDIAILTTIGFFIYYFNENNKSISLNYFYFVDYQHIVKYYKMVLELESTLPLPNHDSFKFDGWISHLKSNKESLLKYGVELLTFAIKEHKLELVEEIYTKCMDYFKEDVNNRMFLSIITSTMPIFNEYYPEFISRYSSETNMIIDASFYNVGRQSKHFHLYSFFPNPQIVNLNQSILWTKYNYELKNSKLMMVIQLLTLPLTLPLFTFFASYILSKFHFINDLYKCNLFSMIYFSIFDEISARFSKHKSKSTITFIVPYIKFVNYPSNYGWFLDFIKPQPSPFVETISNKEIYKTWNGEALINFKWNTYGKYYYYTIWTVFIVLLGCFNAVATLPQGYLTDNDRETLLIVSIILGFIHLSFEIRQIIYNPIKWICDPWNYFDIIVFMLPIYTSIYWLQINVRNDLIVNLLSYSCLFLDLKLLLFFRVFKSYGRYFAIIISVAKRVYIFLIVFITIIMMSFAHAFHILLSPRLRYSLNEYTDNNDTNNPWNLAPTYQTFVNGANTSTITIQKPDENTNMFTNYITSLFAMSLFLTGDSSALSNWSYEKNPTLVILMVLFTFFTVIYLLNVFIGLFTEVIQDDGLEASQLILKAEILAEIELYYLLPHQRRWQTWFPEVIYYYADIDKTQEKIIKMIKEGKWNANDLQKDLLKTLNIKHNNLEKHNPSH